MLKWIFSIGAPFAAALAIASPASAQSSNRVKCESFNYRPNQCEVGNIANVRIVERLGGQCRQGVDWRYDRHTIYVDNGCRAVFDVLPDEYGSGSGYAGGYGGVRSVRCESRNYRPNRCAMDTRGGVRISRVFGSAPCREGRSWGVDRRGIWVTNGCRAEFTSAGNYAGGGWGGDNPGGQTIECNSRDYRPARCNIDINRGADIERILGGECIQGRTWGWDRGGIWVNDGCRARFRIY